MSLSLLPKASVSCEHDNFPIPYYFELLIYKLEKKTRELLCTSLFSLMSVERPVGLGQVPLKSAVPIPLPAMLPSSRLSQAFPLSLPPPEVETASSCDLQFCEVVGASCLLYLLGKHCLAPCQKLSQWQAVAQVKPFWFCVDTRLAVASDVGFSSTQTPKTELRAYSLHAFWSCAVCSLSDNG